MCDPKTNSLHNVTRPPGRQKMRIEKIIIKWIL